MKVSLPMQRYGYAPLWRAFSTSQERRGVLLTLVSSVMAEPSKEVARHTLRSPRPIRATMGVAVAARVSQRPAAEAIPPTC